MTIIQTGVIDPMFLKWYSGGSKEQRLKGGHQEKNSARGFGDIKERCKVLK